MTIKDRSVEFVYKNTSPQGFGEIANILHFFTEICKYITFFLQKNPLKLSIFLFTVDFKNTDIFQGLRPWTPLTHWETRLHLTGNRFPSRHLKCSEMWFFQKYSKFDEWKLIFWALCQPLSHTIQTIAGHGSWSHDKVNSQILNCRNLNWRWLFSH